MDDPVENKLIEKRLKVLHYNGSIFWLIFWLILFFPIAFDLFLMNSTFEIGDTTYGYRYEGVRFWVYFWTFIFFPIMFLLLFLNGSIHSITTRS